MMKVVQYLRVSTKMQGRSGLGIEAQRAAVDQFCRERGCSAAATFVEVESGKHDDRPELTKALHMARITNSTLLVAKLCRLSRNVAFLARLQESGVRFVAADMPSANELTVHVIAAVAQAERKAASQRTREALQALKARGVRLGNPNGASALLRAGKGNRAAVTAVQRNANARAADLKPVVLEVVRSGATSYRRIAAELNRMGIVTARAGVWHAASARALLIRAGISLA